jgi:hypothetical protein
MHVSRTSRAARRYAGGDVDDRFGPRLPDQRCDRVLVQQIADRGTRAQRLERPALLLGRRNPEDIVPSLHQAPDHIRTERPRSPRHQDFHRDHNIIEETI